MELLRLHMRCDGLGFVVCLCKTSSGFAPPPPHSTTNLLFRLPRLWALSSAEPPMWTAHLSAEQNRGKGHPSQKSLSTLELVVPFGFQCSQKSGKIVTNLAPERLSLRS